METKYAETIKAERNGNYYIVHDLQTRDIVWTVYQESNGQVHTPGIRIVDKNTINVSFGYIDEGKYRIIVKA
ncbi:hypothetical protein [Pedobacter nutrimenti]|jgi:hypothetical protein|uniref:Uncharacterized protein n=1 Tax=Pedobacter nutrimenti TaxID=1241337 RepID=A0A318UHK6_9SPHI|nr:hypothetical protein [Pedobacter nutrimenti]PYF75030.1 hypothetical protein B0O44_103476 [Pedobacter nutrimenti]